MYLYKIKYHEILKTCFVSSFDSNRILTVCSVIFSMKEISE